MPQVSLQLCVYTFNGSAFITQRTNIYYWFFFKCAFFLPSEKQVQQCIAVLLTRTKLLLIFKFFALIYRTQNMVGLDWLKGLKPTKHDCLGCLHLTFKCYDAKKRQTLLSAKLLFTLLRFQPK